MFLKAWSIMALNWEKKKSKCLLIVKWINNKSTYLCNRIHGNEITMHGIKGIISPKQTVNKRGKTKKMQFKNRKN